MSSGQLVDIQITDAQLLAVLKRTDEEAFKILKKDFTNLSTQAKRAVVANTPVKTGFAKSHWSKSTTVTKKRVQVAVTIKDWPHDRPRYPFILEHGRHAGYSKSGRKITAMRPHPIISPIRARWQREGEMTLERVRDKAVAFFNE
jgi:hypothetical protein